MREIRPSGSEGGVARKRHPYPYQTLRAFVRVWVLREAFRVQRVPPLWEPSAISKCQNNAWNRGFIFA